MPSCRRLPKKTTSQLKADRLDTAVPTRMQGFQVLGGCKATQKERRHCVLCSSASHPPPVPLRSFVRSLAPVVLFSILLVPIHASPCLQSRSSDSQIRDRPL
eukprot:4782605-Pleurochrysis_carterae.AAC.1